MPSQATAPKEVKKEPKKEMVEVEVLRAIGIEATPQTIKELKDRSESKGLRFTSEGLTTMVYPNKRKLGKDGKQWIEPEPIFINLEKEVARKLQKAGAVRVNI